MQMIHVYLFNVYLWGGEVLKSDFKESRAVVIKADIDSLLCSKIPQHQHMVNTEVHSDELISSEYFSFLNSLIVSDMVICSRPWDQSFMYQI